jgi:hypothetical protein
MNMGGGGGLIEGGLLERGLNKFLHLKGDLVRYGAYLKGVYNISIISIIKKINC